MIFLNTPIKLYFDFAYLINMYCILVIIRMKVLFKYLCILKLLLLCTIIVFSSIFNTTIICKNNYLKGTFY